MRDPLPYRFPASSGFVSSLEFSTSSVITMAFGRASGLRHPPWSMGSASELENMQPSFASAFDHLFVSKEVITVGVGDR